jgi:cobalt/nickel transport system permease protein
LRQPAFASWSRENTVARQLDPRVKLALLLAFLVSLALIQRPSAAQLAVILLTLVLTAILARLPLFRLLRASLLVVPLVVVFAILVYLAGDPHRATLILSKTYLSALSVLITAACTSFPELMAAARFFHFPSLLLEVTQLIYRYLFVLAGESRVMQTAFQARSGRPGLLALRASSGMIAVLFGRSYRKAAVIHHAMAARGYSGILLRAQSRSLTSRDFVVLSLGVLFDVAFHFV